MQRINDFIESVRSDYSKCLDNPEMTPEIRMEILEREMELVKFADKKDSEPFDAMPFC